MALSNRIAVMDKGKFRQVGSAKEVYEFPENRFVASFIGTINTFHGKVTEIGEETISVYSEELQQTLPALGKHEVAIGQEVDIAVRPEKIFLSREEPDNQEDTRLQGVVDDLGYLGNRSLYRIRLASGRIVQASSQNRRRSITRFLEWDDKVWISWRPRSAVVLVD
jgi:putrescine transport system ATP-binding protein